MIMLEERVYPNVYGCIWTNNARSYESLAFSAGVKGHVGFMSTPCVHSDEKLCNPCFKIYLLISKKYRELQRGHISVEMIRRPTVNAAANQLDGFGRQTSSRVFGCNRVVIPLRNCPCVNFCDCSTA